VSRNLPKGLVAPRPASGRTRGRPVTGLLAGVAQALVAVAIAGCTPTVPTTTRPSAPAPSAGATAAAPTRSPVSTGRTVGPELLLLAYEGEAATLSLVRLSGDVVGLPLPDPSVAAVAPVAGGQLVAVLGHGEAFVAPRGPAGLLAGVGWRSLALTGSGAMPPGTVVWSATSSPDGTRLAAVARPRDAESPSVLIVIEPGRGRRDIRPLTDGAEGIAPAWIDDGRVAIMERDRLDRPFVALVAVATGLITDRLPLRASDFGTSGDARTSVVLAGDRITVGPTAAVLETRQAPDTGPATPPGDLVRGGIALSGDGRYLAVAVEEGDPGPSRIAIYERNGGEWRAAARISPPVSASGGWLAWVP
jgi:hypothetical protein